MLKNVKWGIHPDYQKSATVRQPIRQAALPSQVVIPVRQHIGAPCVPVVKPGDLVKKGQLIASGDAPVSSPIHASLSGKVTAITSKPHPVYGECLAIIIESDGLDQWQEDVLVERDWEKLAIPEIVALIKQAGIVGMGGAAFPSHLKLTPPKEKKIDTLIINAAECEPFLTVDHRMMLEQAERIVAGIKIILKVLGVDRAMMGIEDNKMNAVKVMRQVCAGSSIQVIPIPTRYPQGAEKMLIQTLLGREVRPGQLPMDVGAVVQNVSTAVAISDAVRHGIPLIERVVTVSGGAVKKPQNLLLRIGTTFGDAIRQCGGFKGVPQKLIMGGPMMGMTQYTVEVPVIKGTSGILVLSRKDISSGTESACIRCGRCVKRCPMGLNPSMLSILGEREWVTEAQEEYHLFDCMECGCCTYICPAKRNIVHYIKYAKKLAAENKGGARG